MAYSIDDLLYLMARLREPETGCPWDLTQSYASIAPSTLEEAYEVVDTIERGDYDHLEEELGDLLFQVIFYSQLAREEQRFDFERIVDGLVTKLVRRHPHVFPDGDLSRRCSGAERDSAEVKGRWEAIKQQERADKGVTGSLDDVPLNLPALSRAAKLQKRASGQGFDWPDLAGPLAKVHEELAELEQTLQADTPASEVEAKASRTDELGDLLFSVVNLARHLSIDSEAALRAANRKFEERFRWVEQAVPGELSEHSPESLDSLWREAKRKTQKTEL